MCVRFSGEGSSETYLAAVVVYVFLLVVWVLRIFVLSSFSDDVFLGYCGLPSPYPSPTGRGNQVSENQRAQDWESDGR